jgi:hypothetical protein
LILHPCMLLLLVLLLVPAVSRRVLLGTGRVRNFGARCRWVT